jgi:thiol-disulfide isomerase/thioredoxin
VTQLASTVSYLHASRLLEGDDEAPPSFDGDDDPLLESVLVTLFARHHFGEGWAADLTVPAGMVVLSAASGEQRRVSGLGDIELGGRYDLGALWGAGGYWPSLTLRLAAGLPTGERATLGIGTEVDPTVLSVGTGAFSAIGALRYTQFVHRYVAFALPFSLRYPVSDIDAGTTVAPTAVGGLDMLGFVDDWLILRAGLAVSHRDNNRSDLEGTELNSGGDWVRASLHGTFRIQPVSLGIGATVPVYADVNGRQITETFSLNATLAVTFGAGGEEDDHDHGDEHDHHGHGNAHDHHDEAGQAGDVRDVAVGGSSFSMENVVAPGRITVVDFWAKWCKPCHVIDGELRKLAAAHPSLTVLRAEVPDVDAPVAEEHLGDVALPTVWIFGRDGALLRKLRGTSPDAVRHAVKDALR